VKCPKCGALNPDKSERCSSCEIFFIKWLIAQHKRDVEELEKNAEAPRKRKPFQAPEWVYRVAVLGALGAGVFFGLRAGGDVDSPVPATDGEREFKRHAEVPLDDVIADAAALGKRYGASIAERDLRTFVLQGMDSYRLPNLRKEAARLGRDPEKQDIPQNRYFEFKRTPYRCVVSGETGHYTYLGKEIEGASECWAMGTEGRIENKLMVVYYFWERLQWVPEKGQWALFTREQERYLYGQFIERTFDERAERIDLEESKALFATAGGDAGKRKNALAAAFRTRARRAGALFRLEHL
jgi:hypothetical protein